MNFRLRLPGTFRRQTARALSVPILALAAWSCQDSTGPAVAPDGAAPRLGQASAFYCSTAAATPNGMQKGHVPLHFPTAARSADGSTMDYRYRRVTPSGALAFSADCVIPRTVSAVEIMDRRFQVPPGLSQSRGRNREGGEATIQGCVEDGECILEPIVVVAPAPPSTCDIDCGGTGGMPGTDTGSGGWTGGAGAGGGGSEDGGDDAFMDDETWDCHSEAGCQLRTPTSAERDSAQAAIKNIKSEKDPFCGRIQTNAIEMLNRHFQVWDQRISGTREDGSKGTVVGDVYWTSTGAGMHLWSGAIDAETIAHESMHGMYWDGDSWPMQHTGVYRGRTMEQWQTFCTTA